jgi:hypothetical protein
MKECDFPLKDGPYIQNPPELGYFYNSCCCAPDFKKIGPIEITYKMAETMSIPLSSNCTCYLRCGCDIHWSRTAWIPIGHCWINPDCEHEDCQRYLSYREKIWSGFCKNLNRWSSPGLPCASACEWIIEKVLVPVCKYGLIGAWDRCYEQLDDCPECRNSPWIAPIGGPLGGVEWPSNYNPFN